MNSVIGRTVILRNMLFEYVCVFVTQLQIGKRARAAHDLIQTRGEGPEWDKSRRFQMKSGHELKASGLLPLPSTMGLNAYVF